MCASLATWPTPLVSPYPQRVDYYLNEGSHGVAEPNSGSITRLPNNRLRGSRIESLVAQSPATVRQAYVAAIYDIRYG